MAINKGLKDIGERLSIDDFEYYAARHSWASSVQESSVVAPYKVLFQRYSIMQQVSTDDFIQYTKGAGEHYIFHPLCNLAFRFHDEDGCARVFVKGEHQPEKEVRYDDKDFNDALFFSTIMTSEEYEEY